MLKQLKIDKKVFIFSIISEYEVEHKALNYHLYKQTHSELSNKFVN